MGKNGKNAPDAKVLLSDGSQKQLSDFWQEQKLVLVFVRHFGWPFCREQVAQLRRAKTRFDEAGAQVLIVGMGNEEQTEGFKRQFKVPYPMVCDPEKQLYRAFDIGQVSLIDAFKPGIALKGMAAMAKGHGIGVPKGDVRQLPGVFIIDPDGSILFSHYAKDPADHPSAQEILSLL